MPATLTAPQTDLHGKIREHLVLLDAKYGFTGRLAKENGWATNFAQRVVEEYGKFLFIAREGGHPVSPPPIIDKAWHLHLVHTQDYWGTFCPNILKMQLHHSPATGTHDEAAKFADWSGMTLASYQKFFGPPPPLWLPNSPRRRPDQPPTGKIGAFFAAIGFMVAGGGLGAGSPNAIAVGIFLFLVGVAFLIVTHASASPGGDKRLQLRRRRFRWRIRWRQPHRTRRRSWRRPQLRRRSWLWRPRVRWWWWWWWRRRPLTRFY
jgi:hypothetical protein